MATGAVTVVTCASLEGGLFDVCEILPGFLPGFAVIVVVSLPDREPPPEVREIFARV